MMFHAAPRPITVLATFLRLAGLLAASALPACEGGGARGPGPTPAPLVPAIRLIGTHFITGGVPPLVAQRYVTIDGIIRPTFTGSQGFLFRPECRPVAHHPDQEDCLPQIPQKLPPTRWAALEILPKKNQSHPDGAHPSKDESPKDEPPEISRTIVKRGPSKTHVARAIRAPAEATFVARPMPDLTARAVITPEMTLPGGGVLRTWIGIEEPAWDERAAPVVFSVGRAPAGASKPEPLFRRLVDPTRKPADRRWIPVEIPLADRGDEPFRLVFETLPRRDGDTRTSLPVWGDPTILRPESERRRPRHVVLISLDTLRARSMSAYGYGLPTTPNFDRMLREGTLFDNAFTTYSNTLGAHMSMMTGLYPANHRVLGMTQALRPMIPTLAERMREAGYETAAFTEDALLRASAGFQRGFARYFENTEISHGAGDAEGTFRRALAWARRQPDQPLFLFVHTYEVHAPYAPPADTADALPSPAPGSDESLRKYEREIVRLDRLLADFVAGLEKLGAADDLLLVITADHGEEFHEHGAVTHVQLYDEVMHIPLFLRWPGHVPTETRIETPVSLVDVVPTVLELVGATPPPGDGVSLLPLLQDATVARDVVYGQSTKSPLQQRQRHYLARNERAKCMVPQNDDGRVECYDLIADPDEKHPLAPDTSPELQSLYEKALAYRALARQRPTPEKEGAQKSTPDEPMEPAREEKLRALGYIE